MGQIAGKPHLFSTLLHHLLKVQGLLVSGQQIQACFQTVVEYNSCFPDEGSVNLKIWNWVKKKKMLNEQQDREKILQYISGPCGPSLKP